MINYLLTLISSSPVSTATSAPKHTLRCSLWLEQQLSTLVDNWVTGIPCGLFSIFSIMYCCHHVSIFWIIIKETGSNVVLWTLQLLLLFCCETTPPTTPGENTCIIKVSHKFNNTHIPHIVTPSGATKSSVGVTIWRTWWHRCHCAQMLVWSPV